MAESELAKRFEQIAADLPGPVPDGLGGTGGGAESSDRLLDEVVYAFMLWEAGHERAGRAMASIRREFVDHNELRVALIDELRAVIGKTYPKSEPRCAALRETLNAIFERRHGLSLAGLETSGKREIRAFFESVEPIPAFITARVCLSLGVHIFPLDARLLRVACELVDDGTFDEGETPEVNATRAERALRAGEAARVYAILEGVSAAGVPKGRKKAGKTRAKGGAKGAPAANPKPASKNGTKPAPKAGPKSGSKTGSKTGSNTGAKSSKTSAKASGAGP